MFIDTNDAYLRCRVQPDDVFELRCTLKGRFQSDAIPAHMCMVIRRTQTYKALRENEMPLPHAFSKSGMLYDSIGLGPCRKLPLTSGERHFRATRPTESQSVW